MSMLEESASFIVTGVGVDTVTVAGCARENGAGDLTSEIVNGTDVGTAIEVCIGTATGGCNATAIGALAYAIGAGEWMAIGLLAIATGEDNATGEDTATGCG